MEFQWDFQAMFNCAKSPTKKYKGCWIQMLWDSTRVSVVQYLIIPFPMPKRSADQEQVSAKALCVLRPLRAGHSCDTKVDVSVGS